MHKVVVPVSHEHFGLACHAVHAGMAGKTEMLVAHWNNHFVHVPMALSAGQRKQVNPDGKLWSTVLGATGQGSMRNQDA